MIDTIRYGTLAERLALAASLVVAAVVLGWFAAYLSIPGLQEIFRDAGLTGAAKRGAVLRFLQAIAGSGFVILVAGVMARGAEEMSPGVPMARGARTAAATTAWVAVVAAIGYIVLAVLGSAVTGGWAHFGFQSLQYLALPLAAAFVAGGAAADDVEAELDAEEEDAAATLDPMETPPAAVVVTEPNVNPPAPYRAWEPSSRSEPSSSPEASADRETSPSPEPPPPAPSPTPSSPPTPLTPPTSPPASPPDAPRATEDDGSTDR